MSLLVAPAVMGHDDGIVCTTMISSCKFLYISALKQPVSLNQHRFTKTIKTYLYYIVKNAKHILSKLSTCYTGM